MTTFWPEPLVVTTSSVTSPGPAATAGMVSDDVSSERVSPDLAGTVCVVGEACPSIAKATWIAAEVSLTAWPMSTASAPAALDTRARSRNSMSAVESETPSAGG